MEYDQAYGQVADLFFSKTSISYQRITTNSHLLEVNLFFTIIFSYWKTSHASYKKANFTWTLIYLFQSKISETDLMANAWTPFLDFLLLLQVIFVEFLTDFIVIVNIQFRHSLVCHLFVTNLAHQNFNNSFQNFAHPNHYFVKLFQKFELRMRS